MSIYGNPVMLGGSGGGGGGGGNAWSGTSAPSDAVGENGQYYFQLSAYSNVFTGSFTGNANTGIAGWEFTANDDIVVVGLRGYARSSYTGTLKLGDTSQVIVEVPVALVANQWVEVMLQTPVTLTAGTNYIVMLFGNSSTLRYTSTKTFSTNRITYVRARYGSYPGSTEANNLYAADIIIQNTPPLPISAEYYKTGGVWMQA